MDNLTGGPFGLYLTTYLWMFIGIRWVITFMDVEDSVLMLFIVAAGVLIQNFIIIGTTVMFEPVSRFSPAAISTVLVQVLWAVFTGPIFLVFFNYSHKRWDKWLKEVFAKEKGDRYGLIE
jgi:rod shape-determining protein MreD